MSHRCDQFVILADMILVPLFVLLKSDLAVQQTHLRSLPEQLHMVGPTVLKVNYRTRVEVSNTLAYCVNDAANEVYYEIGTKLTRIPSMSKRVSAMPEI